MSEVTVLGLCSDNLVSIIQPSSTVECAFGTGNGCCGLEPTQTTMGITGAGFTSTAAITLPLNTTTPAIVSGSVQLTVTATSPAATLQTSIPSSSWYSTVFVPSGTAGITVSVPFSITTISNTINLALSVQSGGMTVSGYAVPYTVLTL
jgi:hypothetical protein